MLSGGERDRRGAAVSLSAGKTAGATPFILACTPWARLRGMKAYPTWHGVLVLAPCADVHTFGIRRSLDIAFVDRWGIVLESYRRVPPGRRRRCKGACYTLERWAESGEAWFERGGSVFMQAGEATGPSGITSAGDRNSCGSANRTPVVRRKKKEEAWR